MLIYREDARPVDPRVELARLRRAAAAAGTCSADTAVSLLIDAGELESAVVDAISPTADGNFSLSSALRAVSLAAAHAWLDADRKGHARLDCLMAALDQVPAAALPAIVSLRVSEGYAFYALYPATYAVAAEQFRSDLNPSSVVIIGIRGIGTSLSAVVAAALSRGGVPTWSCSVRPRGHPFQRHLDLHADLVQRWREEADAGAVFAIVDEGPGISGSSFGSVVHALHYAGIASGRIALFPSWDPDAERLSSAEAREVWTTHARYSVDPASAGITPDRVFGIAGETRDYTAGAWRADLCGDERGWPAVHPNHERWKVLVPAERTILKFVGLGRYGERCAARARHLFELGEGPEPGALRQGFLALPFVAGTPVHEPLTREDAAAIGRYIGRIAAAFQTHGRASAHALVSMIETNIGELLGRRVPLRPPADGPEVRIDGRMLAHEWLRTAGGLKKTDALDHHGDHFYPGVQDPAWDLAAAIVELRLGPAGRGSLLAAYERFG